MVSNGRWPGCWLAKLLCPGGCQSWVNSTWAKAAARRLTLATTSSPPGTARAPPAQKSFCTSTTSSRSWAPGLSRVVIAVPLQDSGRDFQAILLGQDGRQWRAAVDDLQSPGCQLGIQAK